MKATLKIPSTLNETIEKISELVTSWANANLKTHQIIDEKQLESSEARVISIQNELILLKGCLHDVKNIILEAMSSCKKIKGHTMSSDEMEKLKFIESALKIALNYSRPQNKNTFNIFNLIEVIESIDVYYSKLALEKELKVNFHIDKNLPDYIQGDEYFLGRVILNCVGNAIKYVNKGGEIYVNLSYFNEQELIDGTNGILFIEVRDNGIGISTEKLNKIKSINTVDSSPGINGEAGTGFGLYSIFAEAKNRDYFADINSDLGIGTNIKIGIPMALVNGKTMGLDTQNIDLNIKKIDETILLVDDREEICLMIKDLLSEKFNQEIIFTANSKEQFLELLFSKNPTIVIMDNDLGNNINGIDLMLLTKDILPSMMIPNFIAFTGNVDKQPFLLAGMCDAIDKAEPHKLIHAIMEIMDKRI